MLCPYCRTDNAAGALRCRACTSWLTDRPPAREWTRAREGRMIGGVARGLADRFGLAPAAVRLLFLLAVAIYGWGLLVYLVLWVVMPQEPLALPPSTRESAPAQEAVVQPPGS
jgi:phage shock protein C